MKVSEDLEQPYIEEIIPDLHHEIIFQLNSAQSRQKGGDKDWVKDPEVYFAGQNSKSYKHQFSPGAIIYGVRFHPHTQALFYNFPATLNTDTPIPLIDIAGNDTLLGCISESPQKTFANLERELTKKASRLDIKSASFRYADYMIHEILNYKGNIKISDFERNLGVSGRYLGKVFNKFVGLNPKQFCNMVRFNHFVNIRKNNPGMPLTECAYAAEFYDQSHLIRQSHIITGKSPKSLFYYCNDINDHFLEN
ncbi:hypothetical protein GCM10009122_52140 [Fulvivirga kasyanovii]|nr:helix-turn-helix domain-containing protein [Fulvivirga kasyanovii]